MRQKVSKSSLLEFAKGIKPEPPAIAIGLEVNHKKKEVEVFMSYVLPYEIKANIVLKETCTSEDFEFWQNFDSNEIVQREQQRLTGKINSKECNELKMTRGDFEELEKI